MRGKFWTQSNFSRWHGEELGSAMPTRMVGLVFVADDDAMVAVGNIGGAELGAVCAVACCNHPVQDTVLLTQVGGLHPNFPTQRDMGKVD